MDPILFCLLKDISLFPHCQFFPLFWVIPVDIQISPIQNKTEQKRNKTTTCLTLSPRTVTTPFPYLPLRQHSLKYFSILHILRLRSSLETTPFRFLSLPLFRGTYQSHQRPLCYQIQWPILSSHVFSPSRSIWYNCLSLKDFIHFWLSRFSSLLFVFLRPGSPPQSPLRVLFNFMATKCWRAQGSVFKTLLLLSISPKWFYLITHILQIHISTQKDSSVYPTV